MAIKYLDDIDVSGIARTVLEDTPAAGGSRTGLMLAFPTSPYGLVFRSYAAGQSSIQNQRESNDGELYPLFLNPLGGDVGVGTAAPTQKLHVNGNLRVTGAYYDSNNSSGTSGQVLSSTATGTDWVTPTTGDITGVTAGTGMTGGGTSGTVTLNVIGGTGITANANDIAIDATVLTTTGSQTISGAKRFNGSILDAGGSSGTSGQVLASTGTGQVDWVAAASGTIGGTAADTRIAFGSAANTLTSDPDFEVVTSVSGAKRIKVENGGIQIANMSIGASLATVGSMRYRAVAGIKNISYVDMVMQTAGTVGAVGGTYAWVNIVQNTWN